ncbi:hypothetical protein F5Y03DRAFT_338402 [Xylaria venustula]|nr:hypothetical protein F5Y03DRAFT_338402 [Xylaria venustula]
MFQQHIQHFVISKSPFRCQCGKEFTRLYTLERHIGDSKKHLVPKYPCPHECTAYHGKNGFRRKDHLVQHLRFFHKYKDGELATISRPRQTQMLNVSVCPFQSCEYYRDTEFKDWGISRQEKNRPFDKQSDYTRHMKQEHDWSPYPCKVLGCSKTDGKGFFSFTAFEKHYKEKHPGTTITVQRSQTDAAATVKCDYCDKMLKPGTLGSHQFWKCQGMAPCRYCGESMVSRNLGHHYRNFCKGEVTCHYCNELMESRHQSEHEKKSCTGEVKCSRCQKMGECRLMVMLWYSEDFRKRLFVCPDCKR